MDQVNKIRKDFSVKNLSINKISQKHHRSGNTVNRYVHLSSEELSKTPTRTKSKSVITENVIVAINSFIDEEVEKKSIGNKNILLILF
ncbi:MAG TPA: hypothetical protein VI754_15380 [Bacteriovoracaceae bacterium]|nr:hypothetical protein [Bacteriovoracaceae bacterium]